MFFNVERSHYKWDNVRGEPTTQHAQISKKHNFLMKMLSAKAKRPSVENKAILTIRSWFN